MRLTALLAFAASLFVALPPAHACKCVVPTLEDAREDASALFEGRVLSIDDIAGASPATNGEKKITLAVVRTWKGLENEEKVEVYTNGSSAACGYPFALDVSYLLYTRTHEGRITVSNCSRTRPIAEAGQDLAVLGAGATPVKIAAAPQVDTKLAAPPAALEVAPATTPDGAGTPSASPPPPTKRGCGAGTHAWILAVPALARRRRKKLSP